MSYSPRTGLVYIPSTTTVQVFSPDPDFEYKPGRLNVAFDIASDLEAMEGFMDAAMVCDPSHITAWDPKTQTQRFRVNHRSVTPGGILTTASDLLFQGSGTTFSAYDARSGDRLWQSEVGVGIMAPPISYIAGGSQYIVVAAGIGGTHGGILDRIDYVNEGRVLAYRLGGDAVMPATRKAPERRVHTKRARPSADSVRTGRELYSLNCMQCHGGAAISSGELPDLRFSSAAVHEDWQSIVIGGTRQNKGMASFADLLTPAQVDQIHDYIVFRALHEPNLLERLAGWVSGYACVPVEWMVD
jgi:quinohemoprotein ethanol dehydrogenase